MKKQQGNILRHEEASAKDIYLKRPFKYKIIETLLYVIVMFGLLSFIPQNSTALFITAMAAAIIIVGFAPAIYKAILHPTYKLSRTHLIIKVGKNEESVPLNELRRDSAWKPTYRASGKKYYVMASQAFLEELDKQITRMPKRGR
jgi:capsular polysaccharide biosynthesis protein